MQASLFEELTPSQRRGTLILQGLDDEVHGVAPHPYLQQAAMSLYSGAIHLWDYADKQLLVVRLMDPDIARPHSLAFDARGRFVMAGTTNGALYMLDSQQLTDTQPPMKHTDGAIVEIAVSSDGTFMATADSQRYVCLYRYLPTKVKKLRDGKKQWELEEHEAEGEEVVEERWVYLGRARSHSRPITGLEFGMSVDGKPRLVSVGEDKRVVEYDLENSSIEAGILYVGPRARIEQAATPVACLWLPLSRSDDSAEQLLLTSNDEYKFKMWNAGNKACRRTVVRIC